MKTKRENEEKEKWASFHKGVTCLQKEHPKARCTLPFFILFPSQKGITKA